LVKTFEVAMKFYKKLINKGYEGIMFRNYDMPYEQKRSHSLLKYKEFIDDEFIIIGAEEGKGHLAGHVGAFVCKIEDGKVLKDLGGKEFIYKLDKDPRTEKQGKGTVSAKLDGKTKYLKHLFENPEEYMGKPLTIKYQNLSKDGIPRFPVGKSIRFDK
jgi:DNA ligase-1